MSYSESFPSTPEDNTGQLRNERVVVLANPVGTRIRQIKRNIAELALSPEFGPSLLVLTTSGDRKADKQLLIDNLQDGDTLLIGGGDGTASIAEETLISDEVYGLDVALGYLLGGNGADKARMTNGNLTMRSSVEMLRTGRVAYNNPIETTIKYVRESLDSEEPSEPVEFSVIASAYVGWGNFASIANKLDDKKHRSKFMYKFAPTRLMLEGLVIAGHDLDEFDISDDEGIRTLQELTISNGRRIAKFGKFPVDFFSKEMFKAELVKKDALAVANFVGSLLIGRSIGRHLPQDGEYNFTILSPVFFQADGDTELLPTGSKVNVKQHERAIKVITTL